MKHDSRRSKIFIRQLTVLDCGIWDHLRGPTGCSWSVDVTWFGGTDDEGVVIDFSEAKKLAKKVIDDQFDHRLLISKDRVSQLGKGRYLCLPHPKTAPQDRFFLETYDSSIALFANLVLEELSSGATGQLETALADAIKESSPGNINDVKVKLRGHQEQSEPYFFNYLHSLRLHNGNCQRFHGHSNTIEVFVKGHLNQDYSSKAANFLNGKYLVTSYYVQKDFDLRHLPYQEIANSYEINDGDHRCIEYTGSQGFVRVFVPKNRLELLPTESTIENITEWLHGHLFSDCEDVTVYGFEGLNKGAIFP